MTGAEPMCFAPCGIPVGGYMASAKTHLSGTTSNAINALFPVGEAGGRRYARAPALSLQGESAGRFAGLTQPCAVGFTQLMGIHAGLALWPEMKGVVRRACLIAGMSASFVFLVAAASRGPFLLLLSVAFSWFWLCRPPKYSRGLGLAAVYDQ